MQQESVYKRRRCGGNYDAPLIITGCPRTGTSALAQCLSRHAAMCVLPEACVYDLDDDLTRRTGFEVARGDNQGTLLIEVSIPLGTAGGVAVRSTG